MAKKILVVEDDAAVQQVLKSSLEKEGYAVETASDGVEGLEMVRKAMPDLVLLDIMMPKKDGITVLREMKADDKIRDIPVIILTNLTAGDKVAEAMQLDTFDYLVKAYYSLEDVTRKVKEHLEK